MTGLYGKIDVRLKRYFILALPERLSIDFKNISPWLIPKKLREPNLKLEQKFVSRQIITVFSMIEGIRNFFITEL
jgi:hypothetical protein